MEKETYKQDIKEIYEKLQTSEKGLTNQEAKARLEKYGENRLKEKEKDSIFKRFLLQFTDFTVIILIIAAIVSGVVDKINGHDLINTFVILFVVTLNAVIGVFEEINAEKSLDALKKLTEHTATVLRDRKEIKIPSKEVVIGDVLLLDAGDYICADCRIIESSNLLVNESQLTGESLPVSKNNKQIDKEIILAERKNMLYTSSLVTNGRAKALVISTAMQTEVGKIAILLDDVENVQTPLKQKLDELGKGLAIVSIIICITIFIIGIISGKSPLSMFITAISLAVAAIPEGLPAIATIVQALGVKKLVAKNAIVKKLPAVETLGSATVICSDKTGTLTENKMTVTEVFLPNNNKEQLYNCMLLCNNAKVDCEKEIGDPTETALIKYVKDNDEEKWKLYEENNRIFEIPFNSDNKYMITVNKLGDKKIVYLKGGLDVVLGFCTKLEENVLKTITLKNEEMGSRALRILAYANCEISDEEYKNVESDENKMIEFVKGKFEFLGISGMIDPPRKEAKSAIEKCKKAGITTVMITGDQKSTAVAIAKELGILTEGKEVLEGKYLDEMSDEELLKRVKNIAVYTRTLPKHKVRIVKAFQSLR